MIKVHVHHEVPKGIRINRFARPFIELISKEKFDGWASEYKRFISPSGKIVFVKRQWEAEKLKNAEVCFSNSDWKGDKYGGIEIEIEFENDIQTGLEIDSTLEVIYSPQRICVISSESREEEVSKEDSDMKRLEVMLKKALDSEKYELATMIRDVIKLQKGESLEDK